MYGIAALSLIPCRAEPSDRSEMVTQLLFGDHYEVIEAGEKWTRIRIAFDQYECYIDTKQHQEITALEYQNLERIKFPRLSTDLASVLQSGDNKLEPILLGSHLPEIKDGSFMLGGTQYKFEANVLSINKVGSRDSIVENAYMYMEAPYLWGGKSPFGIDCSGFVQMVFKLSGHKMPRDAWQQAEVGDTLSFVEEAEPGDLAFFDNEEGKIIHVGIMLDGARIIHASGKVRVDKLDHHGIFNEETGTYSHNLRLIKRSL